MERRFDRPCSDAGSDAHAVGYIAIVGVNGVHELFTQIKLRCPARFRSQRSVDEKKLLESELVDCDDDGWWYVVSNGVERPVDGWLRMASNGFEWLPMASNGTNGTRGH